MIPRLLTPVAGFSILIHLTPDGGITIKASDNEDNIRKIPTFPPDHPNLHPHKDSEKKDRQRFHVGSPAP